MKKLLLVVVDILGDLLLYKNPCPALKGFYKREIKSTVPFLPDTSRATLWTGFPVSQHGVTSLNAKKDTEVPKLWDTLDVKVSIKGKLGENIEGLVDPEEADLEIVQIDGLAEDCQKYGIESNHIAEDFMELSQFLESRRKDNIMLVSPCGYTKYDARFNLGVFLQSRRFCIFDGADGFKSDESSAYPASFGDDDALQFGLFMNRKPNGWLEPVTADNIQGNLTGQMSRIPNIVVLPKVQVYQHGKYYDSLPDILFYANRDVVFPTLGRDRHSIFEAFRREGFSINTLMFTNFQLYKYRTKPILLQDISALICEYFSMQS